jgi:5'(3')-deoxyribonucleotidase
MKIQEIESMPHLYLDMDGVQADFFGRWAEIEKVGHYKHITNPEEAILRLAKSGSENVYHFFRDLNPLPGGQIIIRWLHQNKIPFTVLSAPLRMEGQASIKGKREWLDKYNLGSSGNAIFTSAKYKYATSNGKPNVLVDDFGKYLKSWNDAGGIAVKHSDESTGHTIQQLEKIYHKYLGKKDLTI